MGAGAPQMGRRERKKNQTRELIAETARRLFAESGFDHVSIAEIARQADVSETTVFNHFGTKEDLVYWRMDTFEDELLAAIRQRAPGESILTAFGRFALTPRGLLAQTDPDAVEALAGLTRMITQSPALLAREHQIMERYTDSLAALLADETRARPGDLAPWVAANALMGVHRALLASTRAQIVAGRRNPALARAVRTRGRNALATLERGLGHYGVR
ncbi:MAG TPA: TetR/AcrR family transcriptional regulator [Acidimicrobiales bacterium]|nr:TetR/AcrR family transcriptional regulator [Acidimicrobiales bacterium]